MAGRGLDNCHSLVFDDGFWRCHAFRARSGCCCFEIEGRSKQTRSVALALGPETRMKSRQPARRPRGGLLRETLRLWRSQHLGRRPHGTRGTEHVFYFAKLRGKSGKAQAKSSPFSPVRHDATAGGGCEYFPGRANCKSRPVCCLAMPPARREV